MFRLKPYLFLLFLPLLFLPQKSKADFDRNLILTDLEFTNYNVMTASQINDFLVAQGSVFANYVIPEYVEVPFPYQGGQWGTVSVRQINDITGQLLYGKTVAQLIYDEAQEHQINPQVILAIFQKESSTITQASVTPTRLAWPMFYAFDETMAAFGYTYDQAQEKAADFGGVGHQVAYAAANFRDKYNKWANGTYGNWRNPLVIDGVTIYPQSIATRLFYAYTPHLSSWLNFYTIYDQWFPYLVDAQLLKKDNEPTVYLVNQNQKFPIPNPEVFDNWGFHWKDIKIDNATVDALPTGPFLERLAKGSSPQVYLMDQGRKNPIPNPDVFVNWGFRWQDIVTLSDAFINSRPTGPTLKRIAKGSSPQVYLMDQGEKNPIPNPDVFVNWGFRWQDLVVVSDSFLSYYPLGKTLKKLAKGSSPAVYYIEAGKKRLIPSAQIFNRLGFRWQDIVVCSDQFLFYYPLGPPKTR